MYRVIRRDAAGSVACERAFRPWKEALAWFRLECLAVAHGGGGAVEMLQNGELVDRLASRPLLLDLGLGVIPLGGDHEEVN